MTPDPGTPSTTPRSPIPSPEAFVPHVRDVGPVALAVIRDTVGMEELPAFFDRAYRQVLETIERQGLHPLGAPVGVYYGQPGETVDLAAGFPVSGRVLPDGDVAPGELPGGRVAEMIHRGSYDTLAASYQKLEDWMREQGHTAAPIVWETYLTMPTPEGNPDDMLTQLSWLLVEPGTPSGDDDERHQRR